MFPRVHFILGIIFAATLLYLFPQIGLFGAILIFLSSFLIDVDHYIFYVIIEKDLSLSNAYNWHLMNRKKMKKLSKKERRKHKNEILFFHGLEPLIILYFLLHISSGVKSERNSRRMVTNWLRLSWKFTNLKVIRLRKHYIVVMNF